MLARERCGDTAVDVEHVAVLLPERSSEAKWSTEAAMFEALGPFLMTGVYVNNLGDEGADRVKQAYGPNYERLAAVKNQYDPTNLFRHNQNIQPLTAVAEVTLKVPGSARPGATPFDRPL